MQTEYPLSLALLDADQAAPPARTRLEEAQRSLGFVPNMYRAMANSPGLLETYLQGYEQFRQHSGLTPAEQEVVLLAISRENGCTYCMAAHSTLADQMSGVPAAVTDAIRDGLEVPDPRLAALHSFTIQMVRTRGLPSQAAVEAFLAAGFSEHNILDIILAIAVKTLSNYSNHQFHTPLDDFFTARRWSD